MMGELILFGELVRATRFSIIHRSYAEPNREVLTRQIAKKYKDSSIIDITEDDIQKVIKNDKLWKW